MTMTKTFFKKLFRRAGIRLALLAVFIFVSGIHAQPAGQAVPNRWLLVFDTSSGMKQRVPEVQAEINNLFSRGMGGRLQPRDSIGIWTFDRTPRTGQFPLLSWAPENAAAIAADINKFIGSQRYANSARFDTLMPLLEQVVKDSGRLTVVIFCDGTGAITNTPYDASINRLFQERQAQQKKARQPFVIVLRAQLGKYTGCSVNFSPGMVNLPDFPPLPPLPGPLVTNTVAAANPAPATTPQPQPPPVGVPLIIVGTNVGTNWPPPAPPAPPAPEPVVQTNTVPAPLTLRMTNSLEPAYPPPATNPVEPVAPPNPPAVVEPVKETDIVATPAPVPVPATNAAAPSNSIEMATAVARTNGTVAPEENSNSSHAGALILGVGLLIAAVTLVAAAFFRARRSDRGSLISRSMRKD